MRGRKPKPTHLKLITGNPGHRPLNDAEPCAPAAIPSAPRFMNKDARREYRRLGPVLRDAGVLTNLDGPAFALYCCALARVAEAEHRLAVEGMTVTSPTGIVRPSPW